MGPDRSYAIRKETYEVPDFALTSEQAAIRAHEAGRSARILAGPGTGKSSTLVGFVDEALARNPDLRVRLLTFTRAATAELGGKVSEHPAAVTLRPSTIHSFAISILLRNRGCGNFPEPLRIADNWELDEIVYKTLARKCSVKVPRLKGLIREMAAGWESLRSEQHPNVDSAERARFLGAWNEHRQLYGYTLLAELPYALRMALHNHPDLEGVNFHVLVVDEYQDLNACDLNVLHLIAERGCSIIGAGDDDQSVYSFRKAAPEGIRRFLTDYPGAADYPLSVGQRCARRIAEWSSYVIQGDLTRLRGRPPLVCAERLPEGEVALLSFPGHVSEAKGIAELVRLLTTRHELPPEEILILLRSDHNGSFSRPIKHELDRMGIPTSDPEEVECLLAEPENRRLLETFRLLTSPEDSIAWASLLRLAGRVGDRFFEGVYELARAHSCQFGRALLLAYESDFRDLPRAPGRQAKSVMQPILEWLSRHDVPDACADGWGQWIAGLQAEGAFPAVSDELRRLLLDVDQVAESEQGLERYLSQISPSGRDLALARSEGVRVMTMAGAKGLTVRATIVGAVEEGIVPRPSADCGEERRLLYVAMTRATELLFCTWARRRRGPTARAGRAFVGDRRQYSTFLTAGPVESQDGMEYLKLVQGQ